MMMQRLTLGAAALAITLALTPGGVRASDDDPVVATVNGTKVHKCLEYVRSVMSMDTCLYRGS